jgi:broad specificity phosphatase PhoE
MELLVNGFSKHDNILASLNSRFIRYSWRRIMTQIILVRHGQTEWNRIERFRGRADVPLNQTGLAQAEAAGRRIAAQWQPVVIYSSPLSRAVKTAEAIQANLIRLQSLDLSVQIHPGLADIDYGQWQGLTPEEARERWPEAIATWYSAPQQARIPGGETLADLRRRAMAATNELASRYGEQSIVLVGHTVINRIILLGVLGLGNERFWRLRQEPCAINVFETEGDDFTLLSMNDTCHLLEI